MKSATVAEGLRLLKEASEIEACTEPFIQNSAIKKMLVDPLKHENHLCLDQ